MNSTDAYKASVRGQAHKTGIFTIVFFSCVFFTIFYLLIRQHPFNMPFVDDWLLVPWAAGKESFSSYHLFGMTNGHQMLALKLYSFLSGKFFNFNLLWLSYHSLAVFSVGYGLIVYSFWMKQSRSISTKDIRFELFFLFLLVALLFGPRQIQNFTQLICFAWGLAIFFIGLFCVGWNLKGPLFYVFVLTSILLAPSTIALGLVIPLYVLLNSTFLFLKERRLKRREVLLILFSLFSIVLNQVLPSVWAEGDGQVVPPGLRAGFFSRFLSNPGNALNFFFVSIVNFVLPLKANKKLAYVAVYLLIPIFFGAIFAMLKRHSQARKLDKISDFVQDKPVFFMGLIFLILFLGARWVYLGVDGAMEARYASACLIFQAGLWMLLWQKLEYRKALLGFFSLLAFSSWVFNWEMVHFEMRAKSDLVKEQVECFRKNPSLPLDFNNPCVLEIFPKDLYTQERFLYLIKILNEKNLSFFAEIPLR